MPLSRSLALPADRRENDSGGGLGRLSQLRLALPLGIAVFAVAVTGLSYWNSKGELLAEITSQSAANVDVFVTRFRGVLEGRPSGSSAEWRAGRIASLSKNPSTVLALLADESGRIVASTRPGFAGQSLTNQMLGIPGSVAVTALPASAAVQTIADPQASHITAIAPICQLPGETQGNCGSFVYQESLAQAYGASLAALTRQVKREALGVGLLALLLWLGLHFRVTRRVEQLVSTAARFAGGAHNTRSRIPGSDEIAQVSNAFDAVLDVVVRDQRALRSQGEAMKRLAHAIEELARARDLGGVAGIVCNAAAAVAGADAATFLLREGDECLHYEEHPAGTGWKGQRCPIDRCIAGWSMQHGEQAVVANVKGDPRVGAGQCRGASVSSLVMTPVGSDAQRAAIGTYWKEPHTPTAMQAEVLRALGDAAAVAMSNVRQLEELESRVRQRTAEAERAAAYKSRLLAMASHDLRQPLQTARLLNATLRRQTDGETQQILRQENLALIAASDLTDALLNVAKLESGSLQPQHSEFPLPPLLAELEAEIGELAHAKGLELEVHGCDIRLHTDRTLLRQILQNLLTNAIRYTDRGGVCVRCRTEGGRLIVEVQDTGIGIPADKFEAIFEEFYQVRTPESGARGGLGLGLSIVRRLASMLKLEIQVQSTVGVGTTFTVVVDAARSSIAQIRPPGLENNNAKASAQRQVILLIEDDEAVRKATALLLRTESYDVRQFSGLPDLAERLNGRLPRPALVISDFHLGPEAFGTDAIALARERFGSELPAIVLTGDTSPVTRRLKIDGHTRTLSKPVDVDRLVETIRTLISQAQGAG